jgi:hypothetical protein
VRFFPVGNYLIFYREASHGIEIIRVLHSARNLGFIDFDSDRNKRISLLPFHVNDPVVGDVGARIQSPLLAKIKG